jgi:hypothetical protein
MPKSTCNNCGGQLTWQWEDAFNKFGFGDGDGQVMTHVVANVLRTAGYIVAEAPWGLHNTTIYSIKRDGIEFIAQTLDYGYGNPRKYLPRKIVHLLDRKLPPNQEVVS